MKLKNVLSEEDLPEDLDFTQNLQEQLKYLDRAKKYWGHLSAANISIPENMRKIHQIVMKKDYSEHPLKDEKKRKLWLMLSLFVNLGFLAFFKYGDFLLENFVVVANAIGWDFQAKPMDIILPMGISFYTFQTMSYTIDMYRRKIEPARILFLFSNLNYFIIHAVFVHAFPAI